MEIKSLSIPSVKLIQARKITDARGFFSESFSKQKLASLGVNIDFVQDNHSLSTSVGVVRGLHYQTPPFAQDKLVRVVRGSILDVAVDIRKGSPTYGEHVSAVISAEEWNQILVPIGFAHGFMTLESDTEVLYKVSNYYSPDCDSGLLWCDPRLSINWALPVGVEPTVSDKDRFQPTFDQLNTPFTY